VRNCNLLQPHFAAAIRRRNRNVIECEALAGRRRSSEL
jgi:hypothetical protein